MLNKLKNIGLGTAVAAIALFAAAPASAQVLNLQGVVGPLCVLSITPVVGVADNLDLVTVQNNANITVASIQEECNGPLGYTVRAQSAGFSRLVGTNPANFVDFDIRYDGVNHNSLLDSGAVETVKTTAAATPAGGVGSELRLDWAITGVLPDDVYTDTITFSIVAN